MKKIIQLILIMTLLILGCQQEKEVELTYKEGISISDSWIRPGVKERNTAAFMRISNNSDIEDTLFAANSNLAKVVEIHETFSRENDLKGMRKVDFVIIPSRSVIELKPNGLHVKLIGLEKNLSSGNKEEITLNFKKAGSLKISAEVK